MLYITDISYKIVHKEKTHNDVMQEFAGNTEENSDDDDLDEINRYINTKLPFSKDDTLLGW